MIRISQVKPDGIGEKMLDEIGKWIFQAEKITYIKI